MDRRAFFKQAVTKTSEMVVDKLDVYVKQRAAHWIRPPYALDELEFLLTCTRCGECIEACPKQVIFPLVIRLGAKVAETPAMDLLHKSCLLCKDWPCVQACKPEALKIPEPEQNTESNHPQMAMAIIDISTCLPYQGPDCGACESSCPVPGALVWEQCKPVINERRCIGCGQCREACITEPQAIRIRSLHKEICVNNP